MDKDVLPKLVTKATSSVLYRFEKEMSGKGVARAGKGFTLIFKMKIWIMLLKFRITRKIRSINLWYN